MGKDDIIRATVRVGGIEIFNLAPQFLKEPTNHLSELRVVADSMARLECSDLKVNSKLCRKICERFSIILDAPKLPAGGAALAAVIEHLSVCIDDYKFSRTIWLKLAKNRRFFIRRRFARLLRDNLTQVEADELWDVYCEKGDSEILRNLILADASVRLPKETIEDISEEEGQGYLLSRAIAHEIYVLGIKGYKLFRQQFPISVIYAAGFSGRPDLIPELRLLANRKRVSEDEHRGAIWALSRLGDKEGVFEIAASLLE